MESITPCFTRIAHLSDVHLLSTQPPRASPSLSARFVSLGRELDATGRTRKLARGLAAARRSGARHVVISGDLTEMGTDDELATLADCLHESAIDPDRVVLVPGNHDAYTSARSWSRALDGPLRAFRRGAADVPGKVVEREGVVFLPLDVTLHQPITRSAGELSDTATVALERRLADCAWRDRAVVVVQHHPPFAHASRAWQWIDGLRNWPKIMNILQRFPNAQLLHGHLHHCVDKIVGFGRARIFGAPATVDDTVEAARVRLYEVRCGELESVGIVEG